MTDLSNRIRQAIEKSGKTQRQIADAIGITKASMSRYIHGERIPKATIMPKLADACGVSVEWLQTGKEPYTAHVEMIIDYLTNGTDFQYHDNHGILIRCMGCKYWDHEQCVLDGVAHWRHRDGDDYCSKAVKAEDE